MMMMMVIIIIVSKWQAVLNLTLLIHMHNVLTLGCISASSSGAAATADVLLRLTALTTGAAAFKLPNIAPLCVASTMLPLGNGI